jgi:ankyrin repeat protein
MQSEPTRIMTSHGDPVSDFIDAACVPRDAAHVSGTLEHAETILGAHPEVARASIHTAAILGDDAAVRRFLALDPTNATSTGGPRGWDALTHLTFSRYLRLDRARSAGFLRAATALLDAGASATTGWWEPDHRPEPEWESALYGAAGIAHDAALTRLLLERGADPNDGETVYHTPESYDNAALEVLVGTGRLTEESRALILVRKHDWHDRDGIAWLLSTGVDTNLERRRGLRPLHHALARDNSLEIITLLIDHGADPTRLSRGLSGVAMAARAGRGDVLELFRQRGIPFDLEGSDRLVAACAMHDADAVRVIAEREAGLVREVVARGEEILATFARTGNVDGVRHLLDLGIDAGTLFSEGNGYWDIATNSTALHVAAWRAQHATVKLLIARGAPIDALDGKGRTPLALAVRACVDSYWADRRVPDSVEALLAAGASVRGVAYPSGYAAVDALLAAAREMQT